MKQVKITLLTALLFAFTGLMSISKAQSPLSFGVKGGINVANFTGTDADPDSRTAFTIGASLDISIPMAPIGVESGVYYSQKGAESGNSTLKVDYIEVPVLAKIGFGPPGPFSPHIVAGPYVGFNINAEVEDGGGNTVDMEEFVNEVDIGGMVGLGADFSLGLAKLNAQVRYSMGFTSVFTDQFDDDEKNAVLSVVVGFSF